MKVIELTDSICSSFATKPCSRAKNICGCGKGKPYRG